MNTVRIKYEYVLNCSVYVVCQKYGMNLQIFRTLQQEVHYSVS